jgi:hypothetical protein
VDAIKPPFAVCDTLAAVSIIHLEDRAERVLAPVVLCALMLGCGSRDALVVWKAQAQSPDGLWLAKADTVQNGGFGSGEIHTTVFLKDEITKSPPQEVLVVECDGPMPHPYALDNNANKGGCVGLTMTWRTAKHLHLTYEVRQGTYVVFQVIRLGDVDITVEPIGDGPQPKSSPYRPQTDMDPTPLADVGRGPQRVDTSRIRKVNVKAYVACCNYSRHWSGAWPGTSFHGRWIAGWMEHDRLASRAAAYWRPHNY